MQLTEIERAVWREFKQAPYQGHGICPSCGHKNFLCGRGPRARVCIDCYEFVFKGKHPSARKLEGVSC